MFDRSASRQAGSKRLSSSPRVRIDLLEKNSSAGVDGRELQRSKGANAREDREQVLSEAH